MAKDSDFEWKTGDVWGSGAWHYIGTDDKVAIPHKIQGEEVTSYGSMFFGSSVSGVYNNNPNITDMYNMFSLSKAISLDLSNFNTRNVTSMNGMFSDSRATSLNLSSFDTSNVTDMNSMFSNSEAGILDLSSFDVVNVTDMSGMFKNAKATIGYARTQRDLYLFNGLGGDTQIPSTLIFRVKQ